MLPGGPGRLDHGRASASSQGAGTGPPLRRGVNLGGWLSQQNSGSDAHTYITAADIERIRDLGFDHLRLPVDEAVLYPRGLDGPLDYEVLDLIGGLAQWCTSAQMQWILDLHRMRTHTFLDGAANDLWGEPDAAEPLAEFWMPVLSALARPADLIVDLLNEPSHPDPLRWHAVAETVCARIWAHDPRQWIIVESIRDDSGPASIGTLPRFPSSQPSRLLYGFHFYEPMGFTHQSAQWSSVSVWSQAPQPYPGRLRHDPGKMPKAHLPQVDGDWDRARIAALIGRARQWSARAGVRLHCGEFGVYLDAPRRARYRWLRDVISALETHGIGWCYWTYRDMGFGIYCHTAKRRCQPEYALGIDDGLLHVLLGSRGPR
jgi:endoglucanase